jgi:hypothetical protein
VGSTKFFGKSCALGHGVNDSRKDGIWRSDYGAAVSWPDEAHAKDSNFDYRVRGHYVWNLILCSSVPGDYSAYFISHIFVRGPHGYDLNRIEDIPVIRSS